MSDSLIAALDFAFRNSEFLDEDPGATIPMPLVFYTEEDLAWFARPISEVQP